MQPVTNGRFVVPDQGGRTQSGQQQQKCRWYDRYADITTVEIFPVDIHGALAIQSRNRYRPAGVIDDLGVRNWTTPFQPRQLADKIQQRDITDDGAMQAAIIDNRVWHRVKARAKTTSIAYNAGQSPALPIESGVRAHPNRRLSVIDKRCDYRPEIGHCSAGRCNPRAPHPQADKSHERPMR